MAGGYRLTDHTADLGIRVWGKNAPELFVEASKALMLQIVDMDTVEAVQPRTLKLKRASLDELLFNLLREILYLTDRGWVFSQFQIENHNLSEKNVKFYFLEISALGEPIDTTRHEICNEIKAITRHNFYVKTKHPWFEANILLDV